MLQGNFESTVVLALCLGYVDQLPLEQDVRILFSGLIPLDCGDPREHRLWRLAEKLGAGVVTVLSEATHLVTQRYANASFHPTLLIAHDGLDLSSAQTDKSRLAIAEGDIFVVHVDWLLLCQWRLQRIDERAFLLVQVCSLLEPLSRD